jgi:hypothetical protein
MQQDIFSLEFGHIVHVICVPIDIKDAKYLQYNLLEKSYTQHTKIKTQS